MKKIILSACFCFAIAFGVAAQETLKPAISTQPLWGPTGYNLAAYYYLPDIEVYYDVPEKKFIILEQGKWVHSFTLPEKLKDFDLFSAYKVVLNRPHPYYNFKAHKSRYARFKGQFNRQESIKESTNPKYFVIEGHPLSEQIQASKQNDLKENNMKVAGN
ncbi:hypothetical protein ACFSJU_11175 [Paradesertivirga mongoliensis]|uniref:Uncharacterized protein n=1 Tax=Paradesertivirga mongoliensis TaxID=2100740 RepID=A0ABW4ZML3_9SPHI|nr:hypothetical protein [Pedobacter mongoliensis]